MDRDPTAHSAHVTMSSKKSQLITCAKTWVHELMPNPSFSADLYALLQRHSFPKETCPCRLIDYFYTTLDGEPPVIYQCHLCHPDTVDGSDSSIDDDDDDDGQSCKRTLVDLVDTDEEEDEEEEEEEDEEDEEEDEQGSRPRKRLRRLNDDIELEDETTT